MRRAGLAVGVGLAAAGLAQAQVAEWVNPVGGDWYDAASWLGGVTPVYNGSVRFALAGAYAVVGPSYFEGRRLHVERGDLTLLNPGDAQSGLGAFFFEAEAINPPSVLVGSLPGCVARLITDMPMGGRFTAVGAAGEGAVTTSSYWWADEMAIGGAMEDAAALGAFHLVGPSALLEGLGVATVGVAGTGRLTLSDGAVARRPALRMAVDSTAHGEVLVTGADTRLELERIDFGEGAANIVIADGATLALPDGATLQRLFDPDPVRLVVDGGRLEGAIDLQLTEPENELVVRGGSNLTLASYFRSQIGAVTVQGIDSRLMVQGILASGPLTLTDGAIIDVGAGPTGRAFLGLFEGGVLIDGATLIYDDGKEIGDGPLYGSGLGLGGTASGFPGRRARIRNGAVVDVEGRLSVGVGGDSEIVGNGTVVRQRLQQVRPNPDGPVWSLGWIRFYAPVSPTPRFFIDDGAVVHGTSLLIDQARVEVGRATLRADDLISVVMSELRIAEEAAVESPQIVVGHVALQPIPARDDHSLVGAGTVRAHVLNGGVVRPGDASSVGTLRIEGRFTQRLASVDVPELLPDQRDGVIAAGALHIDIASSTDHDRLEVTGDALLGGTLEVALLDGFAAAWGDDFTVLTAGAIDGVFETLDLPDAPAGFVYEVEYTETAATLSLQRRTDITRDLIVGAEDLGALLSQWGTADERADVNDDGVVDGADLGVLLGDWGASAR